MGWNAKWKLLQGRQIHILKMHVYIWNYTTVFLNVRNLTKINLRAKQNIHVKTMNEYDQK